LIPLLELPKFDRNLRDVLAVAESEMLPYTRKLRVLDHGKVGVMRSLARETYSKDPSPENEQIYLVLGDENAVKRSIAILRGAIGDGAKRVCRKAVIPPCREALEAVLNGVNGLLADRLEYFYAECAEFKIEESFGDDIVHGAKTLSPGHNPRRGNHGAFIDALQKQVASLEARLAALDHSLTALPSSILAGIIEFEYEGMQRDEKSDLRELAKLLVSQVNPSNLHPSADAKQGLEAQAAAVLRNQELEAAASRDGAATQPPAAAEGGEAGPRPQGEG
jgi:hypothetical protein